MTLTPLLIQKSERKQAGASMSQVEGGRTGTLLYPCFQTQASYTMLLIAS